MSNEAEEFTEQINEEYGADQIQILKGLEDARVTETTAATRQTLHRLSTKTSNQKKGEAIVQFSLFGASDHPVISELRELDVDTMTPVEAFATLMRFKQEALEGDS